MKNIKRLGILMLIVFTLLSLVACTTDNEEAVDSNNEVVEEDVNKEETEEIQAAEFPVEIEDGLGNKITIEEEPQKIISLNPSTTEILFALGLGDEVVGVSVNCNYPEEAKTKEVVGDYESLNIERIVEINPDLVFVYGESNEEEINMLKDADIKVLSFMGESIDEVLANIKTIGEASGESEKADEIISDMTAKKEEILEKVKDQEELKVFYEIWHDPLMGAGKGSFMDELITLTGAKNIADDADGAYPQYDLEQLIERDPEVYLTSQAMEDITVESIKARPGYDAITAINNDRVHLFIGDEADIVSRPGPRIIDALELVARAIYPDAFK